MNALVDCLWILGIAGAVLAGLALFGNAAHQVDKAKAAKLLADGYDHSR